MGNLMITEQIHRRIDEIQPLPIVAMRLVKLMGDENRDTRELIRIVSLDAALTLRIMRIANSAALARRRQVSTVGQAVALLGEQVVVGIGIGAGSPSIFNNEMNGYEAPAGMLWSHSLRTALAAKEISHRSKTRLSSDEAFTAGILHDVGKIVINEFLVEKSDQFIEDMNTDSQEDFQKLESKYFGITHAHIGEIIAEKWNVSAPLCAAIKFHHNPKDAPQEYKALVYAVHLGDILAMTLGEGTGVDTLAYRLDNQYLEYFDLEPANIESLLAKVQNEFSDACSLLS